MDHSLTRKDFANIRKAILDSSDRYEKVRFSNGEIHAYACPMINSTQDGWAFIGHLYDYETKGLAGIGIHQED